jgi:hypothetical protein
MKPRFTSFRIDIGAHRYLVDCRIVPPRAPAHAGADSVRFLDPGSPGRVEIVRVRRDQIDVTDFLDADLRVLLRDRCARLAGVGRSTVPARERGVLEFTR